MRTLPIGLVSVILVLSFSLSGSDLKIFLNLHSFIVVFLGTVAVAFFSTPLNSMNNTLKAIFLLFSKDKGFNDIKEDLINLAKNRNNYRPKSKLPLIDFASELWVKGVSPDSFNHLLKQKYEEIASITEQPIGVIRNLAKYPPALGMTGTVMGMISLFSTLSSDNKATIGQSLAIAMTATFYGLILSNLFLLPLADRLNVKFHATLSRDKSVFEALIKINHGEPWQVVEEVNIEQEYYEQAG